MYKICFYVPISHAEYEEPAYQVWRVNEIEIN